MTFIQIKTSGLVCVWVSCSGSSLVYLIQESKGNAVLDSSQEVNHSHLRVNVNEALIEVPKHQALTWFPRPKASFLLSASQLSEWSASNSCCPSLALRMSPFVSWSRSLRAVPRHSEFWPSHCAIGCIPDSAFHILI